MRAGAILLLMVAFAAQGAHAKHVKKAHRSHVRKMKVTREQAKTESLAIWPGRIETDGRPQRIGVPELDRLLADRPALGVSINDPLPDLAITDRPMQVEDRPTGLSGLAVAASPIDKIRRVTEPYLGSPYRTGGQSTSGMDCSGFVQTVLKGLGQGIQGRSSGEFWKQGDPVEKGHLQTGDLLFFSDHTRSIGHVAIYLADGKFVHATTGKGVIVSQLDEKYYVAHYKGAKRLSGFFEKLSSEIPD